jgi:hypothetical protein
VTPAYPGIAIANKSTFAEFNRQSNREREEKREEFFRRANAAKDKATYAYWALRAWSLSRKRSS